MRLWILQHGYSIIKVDDRSEMNGKLEEAFAEFVSATSYIYIQLSCDA